MAYSLRVGSSGIDVKKMQYYLNQVLAQPNLTPMPEDGIYGQKTEFAVAVFQYLYKLQIDGIIGATTWNYIVAAFKNLTNASPERNKTTSTLSVGSVGLGVQKFQEYLNRLVIPSPQLVVDGNFGQKTKLAVQRYQAGHNLTSDGVIGNNTWDSVIRNI